MSDRVERPESGIQDANSGGTDRLSERTRRPRPEARLHLSPNQRAWRRFRRNRLATGSGIFLSAVVRSEEDTSELQSRLHLVCRLLLEKKKKIEYYILSSRSRRLSSV